jgi:hypothetical protein
MIDHNIRKTSENTNNILNIIKKNFNNTGDVTNNEIFAKPRGRKRSSLLNQNNLEKRINVEQINLNERKTYPEEIIKSDEQITENFDRDKTLFDIINDTTTGISMPSEIKNKKVKTNKFKTESDHSETYSINQSESSGKRSEKPFLRNKMSRNNALKDLKDGTAPNYGKFFKPKLIWDPITKKMIIEKPTLQEASQKLQEEIMKNNNPIFDEKGEIIKVTSSSFKKNLHSDKWDPEETQFFYKVLECFGTDFSFLEIVLKPRNRAQIKNKFRKEEKENPKGIENALKKYDAQNLLKMVNVLKSFKEEMKTKNRRKFYTKRKNSKNIIKEDVDYKKIFMDVNGEQNDTNHVEDILKEFSEGDCEESEIDLDLEDDSKKTVSILQDDERNIDEANEYSYLRVGTGIKNKHEISQPERKKSFKKKSISRKSSKARHSVNEEMELGYKINTKLKEKESSEDNVFCYDFLKKFQ